MFSSIAFWFKLKERKCWLSPSNGPNQQIKPHPTRWHYKKKLFTLNRHWHYPLITYLSSKWPNNLWTKFCNSDHCVQAASTASSVVLCPLYLQLVCWRKKAPKIVWSQYLASGEKELTCCCLTSFFYLFLQLLHMTSEMTNYPKGWIVIWQKFKKLSFEMDVDYLKTKDLLAVHSIAIFFFFVPVHVKIIEWFVILW